MHECLERILYPQEELERRVRELAAEISHDYEGKNLLLVGVLKGAIIFLADLSRALTIPHEFDLIGAASYHRGTESSGQVRITKDIENVLHDKDVLLIEDIYDSGRTLQKIRELVLVREPRSLEVCCLLEKHEAHLADLPVKYVGFQIPNVFIVGYGLDFAERFRHLKDIGVLKRSVSEQA